MFTQPAYWPVESRSHKVCVFIPLFACLSPSPLIFSGLITTNLCTINFGAIYLFIKVYQNESMTPAAPAVKAVLLYSDIYRQPHHTLLKSQCHCFQNCQTDTFKLYTCLIVYQLPLLSSFPLCSQIHFH